MHETTTDSAKAKVMCGAILLEVVKTYDAGWNGDTAYKAPKICEHTLDKFGSICCHSSYKSVVIVLSMIAEMTLLNLI